MAWPNSNSKISSLSFCPFHLALNLLTFLLPLTAGYLLCYLSYNYLWILATSLLLVVFNSGSFLSHEKAFLRRLTERASGRFVQFHHAPHLSNISAQPLEAVAVDSDPLEPVHWVNKVTLQMWPYVTQYIEQQLKQEIQQIFHSFGVKVTRVSLGSKTPTVNGINCADQEASKASIKLDVDVVFEGDGIIELEKFGLYGGIKNFSLQGLLWLGLEQLEKQTPPFIGALSLCFYQDPAVSYDFTDLAVILDIDTVRNLIRNEIAQRFVYPNKYIIPLPPITKH